MKYVFVGNGVAGMNAANTLRRRDNSAEITIISKESDHFFSRTALMYVFAGQLCQTDVEPLSRDHYQQMNFRRLRGEVSSLDTSRKVLAMHDDAEVSYDRTAVGPPGVGPLG